MTIVELLNHVGLEHVKIQRLDESLIHAKTDKRGNSEIAFETDQMNATDALGITQGAPPKMHGLILWLPRDRMPQPKST